jgi:hypothetical protein
VDVDRAFWNVQGGTHGDAAASARSEANSAWLAVQMAAGGLDVLVLTEAWAHSPRAVTHSPLT